MQLLDELVGFGARQLDCDPVVRLKAAAFEGDQQRIGLTGLQVAKPNRFTLPRR